MSDETMDVTGMTPSELEAAVREWAQHLSPARASGLYVASSLLAAATLTRARGTSVLDTVAEAFPAEEQTRELVGALIDLGAAFAAGYSSLRPSWSIVQVARTCERDFRHKALAYFEERGLDTECLG